MPSQVLPVVAALLAVVALLGWFRFLERRRACREQHRIGERLREENARLLRRSEHLEQTQAEARPLEGLLPICSFCKSIRDSEGAWLGLEQYLTDRAKVSFTHGVCPDCLEKHYRTGSPAG